MAARAETLAGGGKPTAGGAEPPWPSHFNHWKRMNGGRYVDSTCIYSRSQEKLKTDEKYEAIPPTPPSAENIMYYNILHIAANVLTVILQKLKGIFSALAYQYQGGPKDECRTNAPPPNKCFRTNTTGQVHPPPRTDAPRTNGPHI